VQSGGDPLADSLHVLYRRLQIERYVKGHGLDASRGYRCNFLRSRME
jgi:hypothetical protein